MVIDHTLYPFENHYFSVGGLRYHYVDEGAAGGEVVLMVHGNPTWSFYYRDLIRDLRPDFRVIAPDHIGCGFSEKPAATRYPFTLERRVADLEALVAHLDLDKITLVVHDWGGMIGMAFAARHPEKIARLVLSNTAAFHLPRTKKFPPALRFCRDFRLATPLVLGLAGFNRAAARVCSKKPLPGPVRQGYMAPYDNWHNRLAVLQFVRDIPLTPEDPSFGLVTRTMESLPRFRGIPALICWGAKDFVFDDHFLKEWQQHLPEAEVHRFADAGHYVLEDAGDEIRPLVRDFIHRHPLH